MTSLSNSADEKYLFLFQASKFLSKKGFEIIIKSYEDSKMIFSLFYYNGNISFSCVNNIIIPYVLKDLSEN